MGETGDLATLSVWGDLQCQGGTNLGELKAITAVETWDVEQGWSCQVAVGQRDTSASQLARRRVLRFELADGTTVREYRIADVADSRSGTDDIVEVTGQDPRVDLAERVLLSTTGTGGVVYYDDGRADLTPGEYVDLIVTQAVAQGVDVSKGTVTPTATLSLEWKRATALQLLQQLVQAIRDTGTDVELDYRRNGSTDYKIDLVTQIGSGATAPELHVGRHVTSWRRQKSARDQASRVVPFGGIDGTGAEATIARAGWEITAKSTNVLTLEDPAGGAGPIQFTNQYADPVDGSWYLEAPDGTRSQVTACSRTSATVSSVTVASGSAFTVGDVVEFRATSAGKLLTSLTHPTYIQAAPTGIGAKVIPLERPALRGERNLFPNPWCRTWTTSTSPPDGWDVDFVNVPSAGNGALTREDPSFLHVQLGPYGLRLASVHPFGGVQITTPTAEVVPVAGADFYTLSFSLWVFRLSSAGVWFTLQPTPALSYPANGIYLVPLANVPLNTRWDVTISGVQLPVGTTALAVQIQCLGAYDLLIDAIQLTQTPQAADAFFEHPRGNALWQAGNAYLEDFGDPPPEFDGALLDYERIDPTTWAHVEIVPGVSTRVIDDARSLDTTVRAVQITWNRLRRGDTRIRWSTRPRSFVAASTAALGVAALVAATTITPPGGPNTPTPPGTPPGGTAPPTQPQTLVKHFYAPGGQTTLSNLPASETERTDDNEDFLVVDGYTQVLLGAHIQTPASQGQLVAKFKAPGASRWDYLDGSGGPVLPLTAAGTRWGDSVPVSPAAYGGAVVGLFESGGNGTDDPVVGHVTLQFITGVAIAAPSGCPLTKVWPQRDDWTGYGTIQQLYAFIQAIANPQIPLQYDVWYHGTTVSSTESFDPATLWHGHQTLKAFYGAGGFDVIPSDGLVPGHNEAYDDITDFWLRQRINVPTGFTTPSGSHGLFHLFTDADDFRLDFVKDGGTDLVRMTKNGGTPTNIGVATSDIIAQGWVEVALHYVRSGGSVTVDFYLGTPCSSLTSIGTLPGSATGIDYIQVNNYNHNNPGAGQFFHLGDWELVPESVLANPFGYS